MCACRRTAGNRNGSAGTSHETDTSTARGRPSADPVTTSGNGRAPVFSTLSVSIITFLFTGCLALVIALAGATKTTSYDRDSALLKSSIQSNAQAIHDLTVTVNALAVQYASLQQQVDALANKSQGGKP